MRVSAIIPAYNEQSTIGEVIDRVKSAKGIDEIIVVSDGSTDATAWIAWKNGAEVIEMPCNMGKGAAVNAGVRKCSGQIVILLDADLIGLQEHHIEKLMEPVLNDEADMTIGVFRSGRLRTDLAHRICPYLSGQRAVKKSILEHISDIEITGYGVEIALTLYSDYHHMRIKEVVLEDITHVMKEEKLGIMKGFMQRMKMYWQIYKGIKLVRR